jgi:putative RNA 2'-phosphotransferase
MDELAYVVANNAKQRFSFNEDKTKIRANQGHSFPVDLELKAITPPTALYHGTVAKFLDAIKEKGLIKMNRQHVHLSPDVATATNVGSRRGKPVILTISAGEMHTAGYHFFLSANGVWLTAHVPVSFVEFEI